MTKMHSSNTQGAIRPSFVTFMLQCTLQDLCDMYKVIIKTYKQQAHHCHWELCCGTYRKGLLISVLCYAEYNTSIPKASRFSENVCLVHTFVSVSWKLALTLSGVPISVGLPLMRLGEAMFHEASNVPSVTNTRHLLRREKTQTWFIRFNPQMTQETSNNEQQQRYTSFPL